MTNRFSAFAATLGSPNRATRLAISTALAAGVLTGCTAGGAHPDKFASSAQTALARGSATAAVDNAEKAVLADPRNAAYRVLLGNAYLKAGRFESARQAYDEAMDLGEDSSRTALSLALADIALGRHGEAIDTLNSYRDSLPASDYGLALALAGQPQQGAQILGQALRGGENTPKVRQNLALAYALSGMWREARTMAAQDVPADQLGDRMEQWALMGYSERTRDRVATLLGVPLRGDTGQPQALALANFPAAEQLATEAATRAEPAAAAPALAEAAVMELPATETSTPAPALADSSSQSQQTQLALIDLPASQPTASQPYVRPAAAAPARKAAVAAAKPVAVPTKAGTHLVQLGSFSTAEGARRAWRHYTARNPSLNGFTNVTTQVSVNGKQFWRVQAAGFGGFASASSMCGSVKSRGGVCLVMRGNGPATPGQQRPTETRMAKR
ncbi:SPOR domain-containing protein [Novosphingobium taihuense]|uniref:Flp pilus assembly protein TadD/cell division protein FtsN n=1 Tax=Novosphingobium taihuense TaxID=260085 RepID=A0A7W7EU09_9SPHN|nr:SPOR domain-containing protein [Novosphingobium taihuense]MBB4611870.1 Flp pilus assembly protein TadD/cell division protein FtsN [Novosphingobium taihuense]TWH88775.1 anaphase-promoting complex subunit 3 [Novosphingobium taihuense]